MARQNGRPLPISVSGSADSLKAFRQPGEYRPGIHPDYFIASSSFHHRSIAFTSSNRVLVLFSEQEQNYQSESFPASKHLSYIAENPEDIYSDLNYILYAWIDIVPLVKDKPITVQSDHTKSEISHIFSIHMY